MEQTSATQYSIMGLVSLSLLPQEVPRAAAHEEWRCLRGLRSLGCPGGPLHQAAGHPGAGAAAHGELGTAERCVEEISPRGWRRSSEK